MFGYVTINKMELKFKEYYSYKGFYCGLCKCLKEKYSNKARMTLNYDMTFLILLLSSLYEPENKTFRERCVVHPIKEQLLIQNEITEYAASMNIILSYYNMLDNWTDDRDYKSFAAMQAIRGEFRKASAELPKKAAVIKERLDNISELEKSNTDDIDAVSNEFGHLMEEIILYKNDQWEKNLRKIGFYLGKFIYYLDAYEDMEKDEENSSYNPFNNLKSEDKEKYAKDLIMLNLSFLSQEIEKLPLVQDKGTIDNIIYSGVLNKLDKRRNANERPI
ncbi:MULTISPECIES: DUF5685 family protein [unclassified Sedimentibacter]|uniref:DUF5685 family protein n=1 Tax=unclassified Sedimentibacter TaxID=2649220 RepID=UPI0027DF90C5|nr:DUF5685 family protein [Sedimentibacter sp. MB35-C1]WMJ77239.1 DUF5685 family protein [Sedimentibacter sp. MB35-C1]